MKFKKESLKDNGEKNGSFPRSPISIRTEFPPVRFTLWVAAALPRIRQWRRKMLAIRIENF